MKRKIIVCVLFVLACLNIASCGTQDKLKNVKNNDEKKNKIIIDNSWREDADDVEILELMKKYTANLDGISFENFQRELKELSVDNHFAKVVLKTLSECNFDNLNEMEQDFVDCYVRNMFFGINGLNTSECSIDDVTNMGNITEAYYALSSSADKPKTLMVKYEDYPIVGWVHGNDDKCGWLFAWKDNAGTIMYGVYSKDIWKYDKNNTEATNVKVLDAEKVRDFFGCKSFVDLMKTYRSSIYISDKMEQIVNQEKQREKEENLKKSKPYIGMSANEVRKCEWGAPDKINKDVYSWGVVEQWVYDKKGYVYLTDGIVNAIQFR